MKRQYSPLTYVILTLTCLAAGCERNTPVQIRALVSNTPEAKFKDTRTNVVAHVSGKGLNVETVNGGIDVRNGERADVEIISHIKATTEERLKAVKIVTARSEDDALSVSVEWPDGKREGPESCTFEITIPDAIGVSLR